jgi:20S proteasome alpha/beta subunit
MRINFLGKGLSVGCMIAGSNPEGAELYYHDNEGNRMPGHLFSVGSGSTYAYGILDTYYRPDLTLEEAVELGKRAIAEATYHDSGSGGVVRGILVI